MEAVPGPRRPPDDRRLPDGTLLLHVGPHKTGSTAIQASLWAARDAMRLQGVRLVGDSPNPARAVQVVTGRDTPYDTKPLPLEWTRLVRQARPHGPSIEVLSSEIFAHADEAAVARVVADLGADRLHVVVTVRPLARIIPSMWQQNVRGGLKLPPDAWTRRLFRKPDSPGPAAFWRLHRHDRLVGRWAAAVGPERVTVIVLDEDDRRSVHRAFETLLGLAEGTLAVQTDNQNRSLTVEEAEAVRAFNVEFDAAGLDRALHARVMRFGAAEHLVRLNPSPTDRRITLPDAAIADVRQASQEIVEGIEASGVAVVGDIGRLLWVPGESGATSPSTDRPAEATSPEAAARLAMGIVLASGRARRSAAATSREQGVEDAAILQRIATPQLVAAAATRARGAGAARVRRTATLVKRGATGARAVVAGTHRGSGDTTSPGGGTSASASDAGSHATLPPGAAEIRPEPGILPFPPGTIVLHIGPPKTGTTAIQAAFHAARPAIEAQGVHYAGRARHSISAVHALLERRSFHTEGAPPRRHWLALQREIEASTASRIVLSSEFFADARADQIGMVLDALGRERVQVVITLRPLAKILPSQWQQYVQSGARLAFGPWLESILAEPPGTVSPSFWHRHHDDRLIARWAEEIGTDRVTCIVLDERDHAMPLRAFEALTALRPGTLQLQADTANRSLTFAEIEAVRHLNQAFTAASLRRPQHSALVNFGATEYLKRFPPDGAAPKVELPGWAFDRTATIAHEIVDGIRGTGVRVIGDLDRLLAIPPAASGRPLPDVSVISGQVAGRLAMGVLHSAGLARTGRRRLLPPPMAEPIEMARIPTRTVASTLARRILTGGRRPSRGAKVRDGEADAGR